jgi:hypothetical protein
MKSVSALVKSEENADQLQFAAVIPPNAVRLPADLKVVSSNSSSQTRHPDRRTMPPAASGRLRRVSPFSGDSFEISCCRSGPDQLIGAGRDQTRVPARGPSEREQALPENE